MCLSHSSLSHKNMLFLIGSLSQNPSECGDSCSPLLFSMEHQNSQYYWKLSKPLNRDGEPFFLLRAIWIFITPFAGHKELSI